MKKIFSLFVLATLAFVSCKKDEPVEPVAQNQTTPTPTTADDYTKIMIAAESEFSIPIDSVVYVNNTTNKREKFDAVSFTDETCDGYVKILQTFNLSENYKSDDGCEITVHFNNFDFKVFQVLLLKDDEIYCSGIGGQGTVYTTQEKSYLVTSNL